MFNLRFVLTFGCVFLILGKLIGQLDSLEVAKLQHEKNQNDTLLFDVISEIIDVLSNTGKLLDVDSMYVQLDLITLPEDDLKRKAKYFTDKVRYYGMRKRLDEANRCLDSAIELNTLLKDTFQLMVNFGNKGTILKMQDQFTEALESYFNALDMAQSFSATNRIISIYNNISGLFYSVGDYNQGVEYANKSIHLLSTHQNPGQLASAYTNLTINLYKVEDIPIDSIIGIQKKTLKVYQEVNNLLGIARETNNIGTLYWKNGRYKEALPYLKDAEEKYLDIGKEEYLETNYISQGKYYLRINSLNESKRYFFKALDISEISLHHRVAAEEGLATIFAKLQDFRESSDHATKARILKDSLYTIVNDEVIFETEAKFQTRIMKDSLSILAERNKNVELIKKSQQLGLSVMLLLLICSLFLVKRLYANYKISLNNNHKLIFKNEELESINKELENKVHNLRNEVPLATQMINVKSLDKIHKIDCSQIVYVKAEDDGIRIFYQESSLWLDSTMKTFYNLSSGKGLLKIYRSTLVNVNCIIWVNHATLKVKGDIELKIGRTYKRQILESVSSI